MIAELNNLIGEQFASAISWTILHSLWQASLIALIMSWFLNAYKHDDSIIRYRITYASMIFVFLCTVITFSYYFWFASNSEAVMLLQDSSQPYANHSAAVAQDDSIFATIALWYANNLELIASMWLLGTLLFSIKFCGSLVFAQSLKNSHTCNLSDSIFTQLLSLKKELGIIKFINIAESSKVNTPVLIGYIKPVILFPVGLINQLTVEETEAIIAHELAHIKRHDFLHNLFISLLETLFYYHPAVWWISANLRLERENCCDDLAVKLIGNKATYAKTLFKIEELKAQKIPRLALPLARNNNHLLHRIGRIANQTQTRNQIKERLMAIVLLFTFYFCLGFAPSQESVRKSVVNPDVSTPEEKVDCLQIEIPSIQIQNTKANSDCNCNEQLTQTYNTKSLSLKNKKSEVVYIDTLPSMSKSNMTIISSSDNQEVSVKMKDGKLMELTIDGEIISENDYDNYLDFNPATFQVNIDNVKAKVDSVNLNIDHHNLSRWFSDNSIIDSLKNNFDFQFFSEMDIALPQHSYTFKVPCEFDFEYPQAKLQSKRSKLNPTETLIRALEKDGFLIDSKSTKIELTGKYLKINGQKQADNIYWKYKKIFEQELGHNLSKDSKIKIETD